MTQLADYIDCSVGNPLHCIDDPSGITSLPSTLISNKARANVLDQGRLQSITPRFQANIEAMTALVKTINQPNSALTHALKR
jgi:hypothetical protein